MSKKQIPVRPAVDLKTVRQALSGKNPDLSRIVFSVFHQLGGEDEFAKFLVEELQGSKPNGMVRARILDLMLRMMTIVTAKEPPKQDLGLVTEEDLERDLLKKLTMAQEKVLRIEDQSNGPAESASA